MAQPELAIGNDFLCTVDGITKNLGSFRITDSSSEVEFTPLDTLRTLRRVTGHSCSIAVNGYESGATGAGTFAMLQKLKLDQTAPEDLGWDTDSATPASMLPAEFFTMYPLSEWRCTQVEGGPGGRAEGVMWSATFTSGHVS